MGGQLLKFRRGLDIYMSIGDIYTGIGICKNI